MSKKFTLNEVSETIKNNNFILLSNNYINCHSLLKIQCNICNIILLKSFTKLKTNNFKHNCEKYKKISKIEIDNINNKILDIDENTCIKRYKKQSKEKKCEICLNIFLAKDPRKRFCSNICLVNAQNTKENKELKQISSSKGGKNSAAKQIKRSKGEIYFCELCENYFGKDNVVNNKQLFNGFDSDIAILSLKIAIEYNGIFHLTDESIRNNHFPEQVKARDKIKYQEILKSSYYPYIIKDYGAFNKKFVEEEFNKFINKFLPNYEPDISYKNLLKENNIEDNLFKELPYYYDYIDIIKELKKIKNSFKELPYFNKSFENNCEKCGRINKKGYKLCKRCYNDKYIKCKIKPSLEQLEKDIKETNYRQTGKKYNVSDNTIRKWIEKYKKNVPIQA